MSDHINCIIIRGSLGVGKTTIAKKLQRLLNAKYFSYDIILEKHNLDKKDNDFTAEDFIQANTVVLPEINAALKDRQNVILDGCFYFKEQIEHLEKKIIIKPIIFTLVAQLETCIKRDFLRKKSYGTDAAKEVYELIQKHTCGIHIETENKTEEEVLREIIKQIRKY